MTSSSAVAKPSENVLSSQAIALLALLLLPAGLVAYFSFNAGGFYLGPPAFGAGILAIVLLVRCLGGRLVEGVSRVGGMLVALFALYTLLTLLSQHWSHAPENAWESFDHALVYLIALALFASVGRTAMRVSVMVYGLAAALTAIASCALLTRLLPNFWPITVKFESSRLSYPVTYWNALGMMAAIGVILCIHLSSDDREHPVTRTAAAGALPVLATTLYFTLSRGAIAAMVIGVVVYLLAGRPRLWLSTAVAAAAPVAVAVKVAYDASALTSKDPTSHHAVHQGTHVALVVWFCVLATLMLRVATAYSLDRVLAKAHLPAAHRRRIMIAWWAALVVVAAVAVFGLRHTIHRGYESFVSSAAPAQGGNARSRLTSVVNDGRLPLWRVAVREFKAKPILGQGAGTFVNSWDQYGAKSGGTVVNAHSLYLENLDELGLVGTALLVAVIVGLLIVCATRIRGPARSVYAAIFAVLLVWALHAGVDWDWQMPALSVIVFALGGIVLGRERATEAASGPDTLGAFPRALLAIGCAVLAVAPAYMWLSQRDIDTATTAYNQGDCHTATNASLSSISILGSRPEPYQMLSYCDVLEDRPRVALATMQRAESLDPDNWAYHYGLAIVRAASGLNPLAEARRAVTLDHNDPVVLQAYAALRKERPSQWPAEGDKLVRSFSLV